MIEITSVQPHVIRTKFLDVEFIMFNKIICSCVFEDKCFNNFDEIKDYIENQLTEDFSKSLQLEGKPSNLKTK